MSTKQGEQKREYNRDNRRDNRDNRDNNRERGDNRRGDSRRGDRDGQPRRQYNNNRRRYNNNDRDNQNDRRPRRFNNDRRRQGDNRRPRQGDRRRQGRRVVSTRASYKRVQKEKDQLADNVIRIGKRRFNETGSINRAAQLLLGESREGKDKVEKVDTIVLSGADNAVPNTIHAAGIIRSKIPGLYQINRIKTQKIVDVYEPTVEGLDTVEQERELYVLEITLTRKVTDEDKKEVGFSGLVADVKEHKLEEIYKEPRQFERRENNNRQGDRRPYRSQDNRRRYNNNRRDDRRDGGDRRRDDRRDGGDRRRDDRRDGDRRRDDRRDGGDRRRNYRSNERGQNRNHQGSRNN